MRIVNPGPWTFHRHLDDATGEFAPGFNLSHAGSAWKLIE
jgi:hypothetical protein